MMGGRVLGEVEEWFIEQLAPGDTFVFGGEVLRFEGLVEVDAFVSRAGNVDAMIPAYNGGRFPLSTHLAARVRAMLAAPDHWSVLPLPVAEWLDLQSIRSILPRADEMLDLLDVRRAQAVAALREQAGLSQQELARKLKTSQQQISRLESPGYEGHSLSMLRRVAHVLKARVRVTLEPEASKVAETQGLHTVKPKPAHRK